MKNVHRRDVETQRDQNVGNFVGSVCTVLCSFLSSLRVSASLRLIFIALVFSGCSVPNLEKTECAQSRDAVKRFYSFHFGNDMRPSPETLKVREQFLTGELMKSLAGSGDVKKDYFTATDDYPKAFRVGECKAESIDKTSFQVVLLWRDDNRSEQKEVNVDAVNTGGKWLINAVSAIRP